MLDVRKKKVLVLGLGLHGGGAATVRWLHRHGARIIVSDLKSKEALYPSIRTVSTFRDIVFCLGRHRKKDIDWADMIVVNPGVPATSPYLRYAIQKKKPLYNEASLFFDRCKARSIAVTGTRGKSTTAAMIAALAATKHARTFLAGNIKTAFMLDVVDRAKADDIVVLELSSWHLEGLAIVRGAPDIAVVTNLYPDHLNRYASLSQYYRSKKEIWKYQSDAHVLILNHDDSELRQWAMHTASHVLFFGQTRAAKDGVYVSGNQVMAQNNGAQRALLRTREIFDAGGHNLQNALAAIAAAICIGVKKSAMKKVLAAPIQLPGRQEIVLKKDGITFINDTTATTPIAGVVALKRFGSGKNIVLIAGGADKKLAYQQWAKQVAKHCTHCFLLVGEASEKMQRALRTTNVRVHNGYENIDTALADAVAFAKKGSYVLFSPAAASFNLWNHEFERGDAFEHALKNYGASI